MDLGGSADALRDPTALPQPADQGDLLKSDDTAHAEGRHAGVFSRPAQHGALVDLKHPRHVVGGEVLGRGSIPSAGAAIELFLVDANVKAAPERRGRS